MGSASSLPPGGARQDSCCRFPAWYSPSSFLSWRHVTGVVLIALPLSYSSLKNRRDSNPRKSIFLLWFLRHTVLQSSGTIQPKCCDCQLIRTTFPFRCLYPTTGILQYHFKKVANFHNYPVYYSHRWYFISQERKAVKIYVRIQRTDPPFW